MRRVGMGIVGVGFAGSLHVEAVRRLGYVDVVAVASSSPASAQRKAMEHGIARAYGSYEELIADPNVHVVHNTTPNYLHTAVNMAAITRRKHIVCDKPLALTAPEARKVWEAAQEAGIVHAVIFNYRGNPCVQQARHMIERGDLAAPHFVHGEYLQDWLLEPTDYSWRLEPEKGGASSALGDIGSHWCDLAQHITGLQIESVLADLTTVVRTRYRPQRSVEAFARVTSGVPTAAVEIKSEDLASVLVRFENGVKGNFSVGQVCAGHKNGLWIEVSGRDRSLRWDQEQQNELWLGSRHQANQVLAKDPALLDASVRKYAHLPGGHQEGWNDALANMLRDVYAQILDGSGGPSPLVATFEDGYRANCIVDAMLASQSAGNIWTKVQY
jgi:predicted dehydrogenase